MVVVELMGGIGNQMFQYALGRNLAIKNNVPLYLDTKFLLDRSDRPDFVYRDYDLSIFNIEEHFISDNDSKKYNHLRSRLMKVCSQLLPFHKLKYIQEEDCDFNPYVLDQSSNIYLHGYWQNVKYFSSIENNIRRDFTFKNPISTNCEFILHQIKTTNSVCLNVRRTDFVVNRTHGVLENDYYVQAEKILLEKVENPIFFVFSDDVEWCKNNIRLQSEIIYVESIYAGNKYRDYLELMSSCKHFIVPNSSFAWWAAWLSSSPSKIVIAPKVWLHNVNFETKLMAPLDWIFL